MKRVSSPLAFCIAALLAACASAPDERGVATEKDYRTGSNIAQRDRTMRDSVQTRTIDTADPNLGLPMGNRSPP